MKIFISWSGERSKQVAELLNQWIQCVLQAVDPWLSSKDIDRGSLWFAEITNELSNTQNGIVCLTKSNINNPWILFEAGAIAKGLASSRVYTFLIDLVSTEVKDPLAQFNHTGPTRKDLYKLIRTINSGLESQALKEPILSNVFDTYWPQFEESFKRIIENTKNEDVIIERPKEEILNEILNSVRGIDRRLTKVEEIDNNVSPNYRIYKKYQTGYNGGHHLDGFISLEAVKMLNREGIHVIDDLMKLKLTQIERFPEGIRNEITTFIDKVLGINK